MSHANAALTPRARLRLARLIVDHGWPVCCAAERNDVSWPTAKRWAERYRQAGEAGMGSTTTTITRPTSQSASPTHQPVDQPAWAVDVGQPGRRRLVSPPG